MTVEQQRTERQRFTGGPLDLAPLVEQLGASLKLTHQLGVRGERFGVGGEVIEDRSEHATFNAGLHVRQHTCRRGWFGGTNDFCWRVRSGFFERNLQARLEVLERRFGFGDSDVTPLDQALGEQLADGAALINGPIHERLRVARVVALVVAVSAVANHVDDDVVVELLAVVVGQLCDSYACLGVVTVDVEDRGLNSLGHIGAVRRGTGELRRRGKPDLVVDNHVDGAADAVAARVTHGEALGHNALTSERGVAVNQHRQHGERTGRINLILSGPHHAKHDRVDRFEVAGVRRQFDLDVLSGRALVLALGAEVVLDVTRALHGIGSDVALKLFKDRAHALTDDVGQHIQPTAVRHAQHCGIEPVIGRSREDGIEDRNG